MSSQLPSSTTSMTASTTVTNTMITSATITTATTTPSPAPGQPDPSSVTAGLGAFLVVFVLAIVTWLLLRNMTGRLRRMRYREEQRQAEQPPPSQNDRS